MDVFKGLYVYSDKNIPMFRRNRYRCSEGTLIYRIAGSKSSGILRLLKRHFLMAAETPIQVLKEPDRRPQSKSYVWLMRSGEDRLPPIVLYHYSETRAGEHAADFLKGIADGTYVMVDGYSGYNKLKKIRRCCCYAHIRRYLIEAIPTGHDKDYSHPAVQGVLYCNKLFEYERSYKEKELSYMQVYKRRQKDQKPIVEGFIRWLDAQHPEKGSRMDRAVNLYPKS